MLPGKGQGGMPCVAPARLTVGRDAGGYLEAGQRSDCCAREAVHRVGTHLRREEERMQREGNGATQDRGHVVVMASTRVPQIPIQRPQATDLPSIHSPPTNPPHPTPRPPLPAPPPLSP